MTENGVRRLALAVLLRAVQDAAPKSKFATREWATPADIEEAIHLDRCPTFFLWCRLAQANPTVVRHHLRERLPVWEPNVVKERQTQRRTYRPADQRQENARRAAALRWAA